MLSLGTVLLSTQVDHMELATICFLIGHSMRDMLVLAT